MSTNAETSADNLLKDLLRLQPSLFASVVPSKTNGTNVADAVQALREGLVAMYEKRP
jgi:hypothetical protein